MDDKQLIAQLGTAMYESHGPYFKELIKAGYDIESYYDGGSGWGNVSRVLAMVSYIRGIRSYVEYINFYDMVKQPNDGGALTPRMYARVTGIKAKPANQTQRTRTYRQRQVEELKLLRESTALKWIDEHLDDAKKYIELKKKY